MRYNQVTLQKERATSRSGTFVIGLTGMSVFCALWVASTPTQALGLTPVIHDVTAPAVQLVRDIVALPQRQPSPTVEVVVAPSVSRSVSRQPAASQSTQSSAPALSTNQTASTTGATTAPPQLLQPAALAPVTPLSPRLSGLAGRTGDVLSATTTASMADSGRWAGWLQVSPAGWVILGILWPYWLGLIGAGWWFRRAVARRWVGITSQK